MIIYTFFKWYIMWFNNFIIKYQYIIESSFWTIQAFLIHGSKCWVRANEVNVLPQRETDSFNLVMFLSTFWCPWDILQPTTLSVCVKKKVNLRSRVPKESRFTEAKTLYTPYTTKKAFWEKALLKTTQWGLSSTQPIHDI